MVPLIFPAMGPSVATPLDFRAHPGIHPETRPIIELAVLKVWGVAGPASRSNLSKRGDLMLS
jgi:hypothetical protein